MDMLHQAILCCMIGDSIQTCAGCLPVTSR